MRQSFESQCYLSLQECREGQGILAEEQGEEGERSQVQALGQDIGEARSMANMLLLSRVSGQPVWSGCQGEREGTGHSWRENGKWLVPWCGASSLACLAHEPEFYSK